MLLLALFLARVGADGCACRSCNNVGDVLADKICAAEFCIDGAPVPPGDGNPCTEHDIVDGKVVTVHIKDCCRYDNDCLQFRPSTCHHSTCEREGDSLYGWCKHTPKVGCCVDACDCPKKTCYEYTCEPVVDTTGLFFTETPGSPHKTPWKKRSVDAEAEDCKTCVAKKIADCCLTSADCEYPNMPGVCKNGTMGICDGNHECQCYPIQQVECTHATEAVDCAYLEPKLEDCANPCAAVRCVSGYCVVDAQVKDKDKDGVDCDEDCDDANPLVQDYIWCIPQTSETDGDGDGIPKCGAQATKKCATTCGSDMIKVNKTVLTCSVEDPDLCYVSQNCDCCDSDFGARPDHQLCCEAACFGVVTCGGDARPVCFTPPLVPVEDECKLWGQTATIPSSCDCDPAVFTNPAGPTSCKDCWRTSTSCTSDNDYCTADDDGPGLACSTGTEKRSPTCAARRQKRQAADCDECNIDGVLLHPDKSCFLDCDNNGDPVCPLGTTDVYECCDALVGNAAFLEPGTKACCDAILNETSLFPVNQGQDARTFAATAAVCTNKTTPFIPNQCICPQGEDDGNYIMLAPGDEFPEGTHRDQCDCTGGEDIDNDYVIECSIDNDNDCVPSCETQKICVATDPRGADLDQLCKDAGLAPLRDPNEPCDCNDSDATVAIPFGCFADVDDDTFVDCKNCTSVCSGECPPGTQPIPYPIVLRAPKVRAPLGRGRGKRSVGDTCQQPVQLNQPCPTQGQQPLGVSCDCCDIDPYAYPGSRFCSSKPRLCGDGGQVGDDDDDDNTPESYDYNCDGHDDRLVVCEDTVKENDMGDDIEYDDDNNRYMRGCQMVNGTTGEGVFVGEDDGECRLVDDACTTLSGFCLERKRAAGGKIRLPRMHQKRGAIGAGDGKIEVDAPIECDDGTVVDSDSGVEYGSCFEYLEACHKTTHNEQSRCHCDCDICVLVGQ